VSSVRTGLLFLSVSTHARDATRRGATPARRVARGAPRLARATILNDETHHRRNAARRSSSRGISADSIIDTALALAGLLVGLLTAIVAATGAVRTGGDRTEDPGRRRATRAETNRFRRTSLLAWSSRAAVGSVVWFDVCCGRACARRGSRCE
jgi:hypothetical protein